ncbi:Uncharacterized protein APZ42_013847 [Daphnia magna]|uniref:Uncharacterized protein n=1 Tax=Daphnia magna TaxID=35525 RepID=A0A162QGT3_9CRUS|nr:Uncharacterized protein APZ42_013847 [Daphnia magna]
MDAQIKFQSPSLFRGWEMGRYNRWGDEELCDHVELSLSGAEQNWYSYKEVAGQLETEWQDAAGPPIDPGARTRRNEQRGWMGNKHCQWETRKWTGLKNSWKD